MSVAPDMTDNPRLEEKLKAFADQARRVEPDCINNEAQTKVCLINPYLEILGYDVRDPKICAFEYTADIGKSGKKVDYALLRAGRPSILIEANAVNMDVRNDTVPTQLQRYFMAVGGRLRGIHHRRRLAVVSGGRRQ